MLFPSRGTSVSLAGLDVSNKSSTASVASNTTVFGKVIRIVSATIANVPTYFMLLRRADMMSKTPVALSGTGTPRSTIATELCSLTALITVVFTV